MARPELIRSGSMPWDLLPPHIRAMIPEADPPPAPQERPGLLAMAGSLAGSVATHLADGGRKASPEVRADRKAICQACPLHDNLKDACTACGCGTIPALSFVGLDLDLKRSWASSACPDRPPRWGPV